MRTLLLFFVLLGFSVSAIAAPASSASAPKPTIYRPCETRVVVYDARPELGMGMHDLSKPAREMVDELGIRLVRHTLYWNLMETTDKAGLYDTKYLPQWDKLVDDCRKEGICLVGVVHGDPPGVSYSDRLAGYERYARFMADMASRYPSVIYWELFNEMDAGFTCLFGANDSVPMVERGKQYTQMLKIVYPAIKSANPAAWVLCGGMTDTADFPRGIYQGGGKRFFDIMNIHTYGAPFSLAFVERGQNVRKIMAEFDDENKPLWNTEFGLDAGNVVGAWGYPHDWNPAQDDATAFDAKQLEDYRTSLEKNTELGLFNKTLPYQFQAGNERDDDGEIKTKASLPSGMTIDDYGYGIVRRDMSPRPTYKWLLESQLNSAILRKPATTVNVFVPTKIPMRPVGYEYKEVAGGIEIQRVVVDSLVPTSINLIYASEPKPKSPTGKPEPDKKKNIDPRHVPDPWDI
ncbi:MAG: glycoside hydrolase family 5 protein [Armatimonadetes bacterium]|jgi:hypothetical protein|nr:glycoside hydrolase family 5 protein [Armatimonadota bacterium]